MQTLKVLCVALLFATICVSNIFTDLSRNLSSIQEILKQSSSEQLLEFQDVEQGTMMLQNSTQDNCDCGPRGKGCEYVEGRRKCICDNGYADDRGVCQKCTCEISGQICFYGWLDRHCRCPDGYSARYQRCERCDCGPNSDLCYFSSGEKRCGCVNGYEQRFGGCEICDCGMNSTTCDFDEKGYKKCRCEKGYSVMEGKCKECSCGDHGECTFNGIIKSCTCDKGYAVKNRKCEACDCGVNGDCIFDENGKKTCQCYVTFEEYNGICVLCPCKYGTGTCVPQQNGFQCICSEGYLNIDGKCVECNCRNGDCSIVDGKKVCTCYPENAIERGYCEACQCGGGIDCVFEQWGSDAKKKCFCPKGYMQDKDGLCSRVSQCQDDNKCPNSTVCVNTDEGYKCVCKQGFRPLRKNADPKDFGCEDICGLNNCLAGECEITGDHYHCRCQEGYAGTFCEVELDIYPKKKSLVAGFSVLATVIIMLLITTVFFARKIQVP